MKLSSRIVTFGGALGAPVHDAKRRWFEREALLLQIDDGQGHVGQGEAAPLEGYSPDTIDRARASLRAVSWDRMDVRSESSVRLEVPRALGHVDTSCPSARAALDVALLDLVAQRRGEPLHRILRDRSGSTREPAPVPLAALLPLADVDAALAYVEAHAARGITVFKAKIGADLDRELSLLASLRARSTKAFTLRLDANRALDEADAPRSLARLAELDPEYVEEPLPLEALFRLKQPPPVRVALDESLQGHDAELWAARALDDGLVHALVLKPGALGGLLRCVRLARMAARRGAPSSVSHLYDGPVSRAAAAELALALELPGAAGLAEHPGLDLWPPAVSPAFEGGFVVPHEASGLGLAPLEARA